MPSLQSILTDPKYHDLLAILKGARNGFVYGVKIRAPHAAVMSLLFSNKSTSKKIQAIITATFTHAKNLAKFVTAYKVLLLIQKKINHGKERDMDTFFAGLLGGWWVFGERNAINEQIVLYVASRVVASFLPRIYSPQSNTKARSSNPLTPLSHPLPSLTSAKANPRPIPPAEAPFALFAAISWGLVMYVFRHNGERLQPGMVSSMTYLYRDSEVWQNLRSLIWHNK